MTITIAGGTGTVGSGVTRHLLERASSVRVLTRDAEAAAGKLGEHPRLEIVQIDFADPEQLAGGFRGSNRAYLGIATTPTQVSDEAALIDAAVSAGVPWIVKLSSDGVDADRPNVILDIHREIEAYLRASGVAWTMIRPATFIDAIVRLSALFIPTDVWGGHTAGGVAAFVDTRDVAEVAAQVLLDGPAAHGGQAYRLTGSEPVTMAEVGRLLAAATGTPVRFHERTDDQSRSLLAGMGLSPFRIEVLLGLDEMTRSGLLAALSPDTEAITGRAPRSPVDFARGRLIPGVVTSDRLGK